MSKVSKYEIRVTMMIEREGDYYVAYCPALDLSAYARTESGARRSFGQVLKIFLEDTEKKGTLERVLLGLGWKLQQKPSFKYQPPQLSEREKRAIHSKAVQVEKKSVPIPMVAV